MSKAGVRRAFGRAWAPAILFITISSVLIADGTGGSAPGPSRSVMANAIAHDTPGFATLAGAPAPSPTTERSFPVLALVGAILAMMTLALHFVAWRFAH